ncbi:MAG: YfjI family protein [Hyphomicrobium aestuarii]|nr:YfjI family protein [Hyphomicrobium aestuarii]
MNSRIDALADRLDAASAWPAPTPLPDGLPPVAKFDYELLPELLRDHVRDISERMQCPPDYVATGLLVMLSSVIGRRLGIAPKRLDDWLVVPNLWGAVVGNPGVLKTPALNEALRPLRELEAAAMLLHEAGRTAATASEMISEQASRVAKEAIRKALSAGDHGAAEREARRVADNEAEKPPACRRYILNDSTVEKLGALLNESPNGLLQFRDELNGFFRTFEKPGHESDRSFYLEAWNGDGSFTYDRIGRGTLHIQGACLAVLGGIQPGPLAALVRDLRGSGDDGLLQRFQVAVWPDPQVGWTNVDRSPDLEARQRVNKLVARLDQMTAVSVGADPGRIPLLRFSDDAQLLFDGWRHALELRLRGGSEHPMMECHLAKYRSLVPAVALILHLVDHEDGPVSEIALAQALGWSEYLETHARRIYSPALNPDMDAARLLLARILKGEVPTTFAARDVYRNQWSGLTGPREVECALSVLLDFDWVRSRQEPTSGRPRTIFETTPAARSKS